MQVQTEPSSSSSSDMLLLQQKMRTDFINRQQHRLRDLIGGGLLNVRDGAIVWIDENGLLSAQNTWSSSNEDLENPAPLFHAGPGADVDEIARSNLLPRLSWDQEDPGRETAIWGSLLKKLAIKELRLLPIITHSIWKELLADLERLAAAHTSPSVMVKKLEAAVAQEEDDWSYFVNFKDNCDEWEEYIGMDTGDVSQTVYRLAGVNVDQSHSWAALRDIDERLANKIMSFSNLENEMQDLSDRDWSSLCKQAPLLAEAAKELSAILARGKRGPIMKRLIEVVEEMKRIQQD